MAPSHVENGYNYAENPIASRLRKFMETCTELFAGQAVLDRLECSIDLIDRGELELGLEIFAENVSDFKITLPQQTVEDILPTLRETGIGQQYIEMMLTT